MDQPKIEPRPTLLDIDLKVINSNLVPTLRCPHCNKCLSSYYEEVYQEGLDLKSFFEKNKIERYCCRMCFLQDHVSFKDQLDLVKKPTDSKANVESKTEKIKKK